MTNVHPGVKLDEGPGTSAQHFHVFACQNENFIEHTSHVGISSEFAELLKK